MRKKDSKKLNDLLKDRLGVTFDTSELDCAELSGRTVYITHSEIVAAEWEDGPFLTLRGILRFPPKRLHVVVDGGAISFLYNGADVMSPGIVDADPEIVEGDLIWVKEVIHGKPLVVGRALISGPAMVEATKGKAIMTLHYLNDPIWNVVL